ncbi:hypothetical protein [Sphingopyxis sp. FD7]|uniref:hypothetical protein n=1 Tax=Sphingopyxis sp. FD7 TaxID=1914525 RepID=UPI002F949B9C
MDAARDIIGWSVTSIIRRVAAFTFAFLAPPTVFGPLANGPMPPAAIMAIFSMSSPRAAAMHPSATRSTRRVVF